MRLLLTLCSLLLLSGNKAVVVEQAGPRLTKPTLVFALASQHAPYNFFDASLKPTGIHYDVLVALGKKLGFKVEMKQVTRKRIEMLMLAGKVDAFPNALEWTENLPKFVYSHPVSHVTDRIYVRRQDAKTFTKFNEFAGETLIGIRGYNYDALQPYINAKTIIREDVKDELTALKMLNKGRHTGAIVVDSVADWLIMQNGWAENFVALPDAVTNTQYRFIFNASWRDFIPKIDAELKAMEEQGELKRIVDRYRL